MMNIPIIAYPHFRFDNVEMSARKQVKREKLHSEWQENRADYYSIKREDQVKLENKLKDYNHIKDIEAIKAYESLKKQIEYSMYRYNISLGNNLDVYV